MHDVKPCRDPGSFRDPAGHVFHRGGRTFRTVTGRALADYRFVRESGFLDEAVGRGWLLAAEEVDPAELGEAAGDAPVVVEHPTLPMVSYPYEWSFSLLKAAALLHLDLHLLALDHGVGLSDASAYNVQFLGPEPVFIDLLSLRRYRDGDYWTGHRQFCEQFLNPLVLRSHLGIAHNAWFRGALEGIPVADIDRLLPRRRKFTSLVLLSHVHLQARLQKAAGAGRGADGARARRPLPKARLVAMLRQLRDWIAGLTPRDAGRSVWGDYAETHSYSDAETAAKRAFVADFVADAKPGTLWDIGCNTGDFSKLGLESGAGRVIGFDFDQTALDRAHRRARAETLDFLPLYLDAANPSPSQGWNAAERQGLAARTGADALVALAVVHHLAIGRNVPLAEVLCWLTGLAPRGVIEFVPKADPMIGRMLALREDIFDAYDERAFAAALGREAPIVRSERVSEAGRTLYWYDRG